jgi:hypothetical protein
MVWDDLHSETFSSLEQASLEQARMRYAERRLILEQSGFAYSDIDLFCAPARVSALGVSEKMTVVTPMESKLAMLFD